LTSEALILPKGYNLLWSDTYNYLSEYIQDLFDSLGEIIFIGMIEKFPGYTMILRKISPCLEILESYLSYPTQ